MGFTVQYVPTGRHLQVEGISRFSSDFADSVLLERALFDCSSVVSGAAIALSKRKFKEEIRELSIRV